MKTITLTLIIHCLLITIARADTFVETIAELSAKDAIALHDGSIYASNYNNGTIYKIEEDGSSVVYVNPSNRGSAGLTFDTAGNMYVAMYNLNSIIKVDSFGNETEFAKDISTPIGLDWDNGQNLYVSSFGGDNSVTQIDQTGLVTPIGKVTQLTQISSLALDASGDIFVSSYNSGDIYKMTPSGTVTLFSSTGDAGINFIRFDETTNSFYAVGSNNSILTIDENGSAQTLMSSAQPSIKDGPIASASIESAVGLAISQDGKQLYFASANHIRRLVFADVNIDQVRPYFTNDLTVSVEEGQALSFKFEFIDPNSDPLTLTLDAIPSWATFDGVDTITGTPGASDAAKTFTVAATLNDGMASVAASLDISVTAAPAPTPTPTPAPAPTPSAGSSSGGAFGVGTGLFILMAALYRRFDRRNPSIS